ncbi:predicted protein [Postia placenta Mad-698-R]|uniref:Uncharacterized protein n=1 Tax=Postia placenta MAD-698-R-SB12 TaxID=670580 RepID=A0A1X6ML80_9APHY|nr:hypothetical protein POSPLADRAFT_1158538 [Postia placenta MAD-698-R-SB12]EED81342.1 predicted protein [Postia placenta Mad-698-R]OSX56823.1 hypothetical protein POSPLADRAFT_1158538 [Postia placenta MAD-698-R-SB12]
MFYGTATFERRRCSRVDEEAQPISGLFMQRIIAPAESWIQSTFTTSPQNHAPQGPMLVVELYRRLDNGSSSKLAHILGGCTIDPRCESRRSSMVGSRRQSQHMDHAADSLGLLLSHLDAQYESYLKCEVKQESAAMPSFSLFNEEAVGYRAMTWSCRDAGVFLDDRAVVQCLYATVPPDPPSIDQSPNGV